MKKTITLLLLSLLLIQLKSNAQCSFTTSILASGPTSFCAGGSVNLSVSTSVTAWSQKANFASSARSYAIAFSIGTKGYVGLGYGSNNYADLWEYTPATDSWLQKASFPGQYRFEPAYFTVGNKAYICGGVVGFGTVLNDLWEYDPATNLWTQKANLPGVGRFAATGIGIGAKGYVGLGQDVNYNPLNDFWEYDPGTNTWTQKANFGGSARSAAVAFALGSNGYLGTGNTGTGFMNDWWEYNPGSNTWTQKANYGGGTVFEATAFTLNNKGYITTGAGNTLSVEYALWAYDATLNTWTKKEDFPGTTRRTGVSMSISGKAYVTTGQGTNPQINLNDVWEYDPLASISYSWSNGPTTPSITATTTGTYVVILTNAASCTAIATQTVNEIYPPAIGVNFPVICPGQVASINAIGATSFTWSTGFIGAPLVVSPTVTTDYTVTATNSSGCTGLAITTVSVHALPDVSTTLNNESITANQAGMGYQWYECIDTPFTYSLLTGQTNQVFSPPANGSYAVVVTSSQGCKDTSGCVAFLTVGIDELNANEYLSIYPNPGNGEFTINIKRDGTYTLVDSFGRVIRILELKEGKQELNLNETNSGVYYLINEISKLKILLVPEK